MNAKENQVKIGISKWHTDDILMQRIFADLIRIHESA
jgi:hypothetical protein